MGSGEREDLYCTIETNHDFINMKIKTKTKWIPYVTRELSLTLMFLIFESYIKQMKKEIGWSWKEALLISREGIFSSFRSERDTKSLVKFIKRKQNKDFISPITKKIVSYSLPLSQTSRSIQTLIRAKKTNKKKLAKAWEKFCFLFKKIWPLCIFPADIEFFLTKASSKKLLKPYLESLIKSRKNTQLLEEKIIKIINKVAKRTAELAGVGTKLSVFITPLEIKNFLSKNRLIDEDELFKRFNCYVLKIEKGKLRLCAGRQAEAMESIALKKIEYSKIKKLSGMPVQSGKIKGKVRVVISKKDIKKLKENEIIVTPMTAVSYVPYLKNAKAIVTDEGGLTCHAAIISRELKKPCVIGTKIATKVLKDGNKVEVNANKGIVKKIK